MFGSKTEKSCWVSELSIMERQEKAARIYAGGGMLIAQRHVHGRARYTWRIQNHLSPSHAAGEGKGNAHILVQQEAMLFPHGHGFGNAFNLSSISASKRVIRKALLYSP